MQTLPDATPSTALHKIIFLFYPIFFIWNVLWQCLKWQCQKELNLIIFTHLLLVEESTIPLNVRFLSTWSVTEAFVSDINFGQWQKTFSVTETFFLRQKCVFLTETPTETCFCDGNLFPKGKFSFDRNLCLKETCFCVITFFLWRKLVSVTETFCVSMTSFCDINWFFQKHPFVVIYTWFPGKSFLEKWEFPLSWITGITTFWSPAPSIGKIKACSKIAVTFEPMLQFWYHFRFRMP